MEIESALWEPPISDNYVTEDINSIVDNFVMDFIAEGVQQHHTNEQYFYGDAFFDSVIP